jgi:NAD(P)-dependent dehydrogenase (short-subunit alcohol dehydrogenase family)|tara:strand:- start:120 stop:422 length:303 start_codon:yes stop_codon:yes gene_type:complete
MEQTDKNERGPRNFLAKVKENTEDEIQILGTFVRLGVVVWSGFIITLNYVDLPMIKKGQSGGDITFVASVFTGALATFGLTTSNSKAANTKPTENKKKEE